MRGCCPHIPHRDYQESDILVSGNRELVSATLLMLKEEQSMKEQHLTLAWLKLVLACNVGNSNVKQMACTMQTRMKPPPVLINF